MGNFMSVEKISGLNLKYPILTFPGEPEEGKIMTVRDAIEGFEIDNALLTGKEDGTVERNIMAIEALEAMDN